MSDWVTHMTKQKRSPLTFLPKNKLLESKANDGKCRQIVNADIRLYRYSCVFFWNMVVRRTFVSLGRI
jgi:hypothetical protein